MTPRRSRTRGPPCRDGSRVWLHRASRGCSWASCLRRRWLDGPRLPGLARHPAAERVLDEGPVHRQGRAVHTGARCLRDLATNPVYRTIAVRTSAMAALVTLTDALLAFPIAYYMARIASPPHARVLLSSSSSCRCGRRTSSRSTRGARSSRATGSVDWVLTPFGIEGPGLGQIANSWLVLSYLWLPYMILPIYAGLERIPRLAAGGVGRPRRTGVGRRSGASSCRSSSRPLVAGSIFTFSLTLGDYITPDLVSRREVHRQRDLRQLRPRQLAARGGLLARADRDHDRRTCSSPGGSAPSNRCDGARSR